MPTIFLSPSTQDWNPYVTGSGSEEYNMNLLADALIPYLEANAFEYGRNDPDGTAADAIRMGNSGNYDFYLALHSNASPEALAGRAQGIIVFYYPGSARGFRAAELIAAELRAIYPKPELVTTRPTTSLGEVRRARAPSVLAEIGYHDNYEDALWIENNRPEIAEALARALTEFFDVPFIYPSEPFSATVRVNYGTLNLRERPDSSAPVVADLPNGAEIMVYGERDGWSVVHWRDYAGYAAAAYIDPD
ncbi:MAG: N-acetylmuramoyl-L-alanine amidase [Oscillibacter sp.]|nr:N-acetylmuramoyl-L-alanine amidase [Oscillibacter sp.]